MAMLAAKRKAGEAWNMIIGFPEARQPKPYWAVLTDLKVEGEQTDIVLDRISSEIPVAIGYDSGDHAMTSIRRRS